MMIPPLTKNSFPIKLYTLNVLGTVGKHHKVIFANYIYFLQFIFIKVFICIVYE